MLIITVLLAQLLALNVLPESAPGRSGTAYWSVAVLIAIVFMASLLAHELAHALVGSPLQGPRTADHAVAARRGLRTGR